MAVFHGGAPTDFATRPATPRTVRGHRLLHPPLQVTLRVGGAELEWARSLAWAGRDRAGDLVLSRPRARSLLIARPAGVAHFGRTEDVVGAEDRHGVGTPA